MARAFILLFDSFGIGASQDASQYGDTGANTLGHIAQYCAEGKCDTDKRQGILKLPNLNRFGLGLAALASTGKLPEGLTTSVSTNAMFGYATPQGRGKDTTSGHWEIAGVPLLTDWGYFPAERSSFPPELIQNLINTAQLPGVLGNCHASGTEIIADLGEEHIRTGKPIIYTSTDSIFQIAAHEESFGLERLYEVCHTARRLVDAYHISRVIARPFRGTTGNFFRTENRRDLATTPPESTLLDYMKSAGGKVIAVGKTADIFAHRGITQVVNAHGNLQLFDATLKLTHTAPSHSLIFTNFVDFDMLYGHRRDVAGYATALEELDAKLPLFEAALKPDDLAIITADHGCDPTQFGSNHTREHIPVLALGHRLNSAPKFLGRRETFADIGQSIAKHLQIAPLPYGVTFL